MPAARSLHIKFMYMYTCMYTCIVYVCVHAYGSALQAVCSDHHASPQCKPGSSTKGVHELQESEVQSEYDNILREAKLLRMDLQHALTKCLEHRVCTMHCRIGFMHAMTDFANSAFEYCKRFTPPATPLPCLYQPNLQTKSTDPQEVLQCFYIDSAVVPPCACAVGFSIRITTFCQCFKLHHHNYICCFCR